ncbi:hypothetical protein ABZV14_23145 [Streptosporangium canum]|uniref:hypothetical protein n=1 Tax=Streptosporangium canum TaxID=324952 RepID=UPI0033A15250
MDFKVLKARFFDALDREDGSITAAARAVGVNRDTAYAWARQAGVRGRGKTGTSGHPGRAEYERLRAAGVRRRDAAARSSASADSPTRW